MFSARVFALLVMFVTAVSACNTLVYGRDNQQHCVDPCMEGQYIYKPDGMPVCLLDGEGKICPRESIAYDKMQMPLCVTRNGPDKKPCPPQSIFYDANQLPGCYDMCQTVRFYLSNPVCLNCAPDQVLYKSDEEPKCYKNCKSIAYFNGNPQCMQCTSDKVLYNAAQKPGCYDCQSIGWFQGNPICLNCDYNNLRYDNNGHPYCMNNPEPI